MARHQTPIPPSGTSRLFSGSKSSDRGTEMTRERIASDLAAFQKAGGRIEVLGNTRVLKPSEAIAAATAEPVSPPPRRRR